MVARLDAAFDAITTGHPSHQRHRHHVAGDVERRRIEQRRWLAASALAASISV